MTAADVKRTESVVEAVVDGAIGRITLNRPEAMNRPLTQSPVSEPVAPSSLMYWVQWL